MEERKTNGQSSKAGDHAEELEIIDIADLLEDSESALAEEKPDLEEPDLADISAVDFEMEEGEDPLDLNDIFSELEEADDEGGEEIIDLVDVVDTPEEVEDPMPAEAQEVAEALEEETREAVEPPDDEGRKVAETAEDESDDFSFEDFDLETAPPGEDDLDLDEDFIAAFELEEILGDSPKSLDGIGMSEDASPEPPRGDVDLVDSFDLDLSEDFDDMAGEKEAAPPVAAPREKDVELPATSAAGFQALGSLSTVPADDSVSGGQIDAAVERIASKMVGDKIDAAVERIAAEMIGAKVNAAVERIAGKMVAEKTGATVERIAGKLVGEETGAAVERIAGKMIGDKTDAVVERIAGKMVGDKTDAVVERVAAKMVGDKIDAILSEAIEKAVLQEIGRLKKILNS